MVVLPRRALFDAIRNATGNRSSTYLLFGHSEGGQFVHRLVLLVPEARYSRAVAANPGWYTMPRFDIRFPYGLRGSPVTEAALAKSLGRDVLIMLGDQDTNPADPDMRQAPAAKTQGATRFERGHRFLEEAKARSAELKCALGWRLQVVRGARHSDREMARDAAEALVRR